MTEVDYSSKQDEEQSWEADYARKPNLPKCWDMLTEPDGQEKKQETFKSWESSVKHQEVSKAAVSLEQRKQEIPKLRSTLQEEQKKAKEAAGASNSLNVTVDVQVRPGRQGGEAPWL